MCIAIISCSRNNNELTDHTFKADSILQRTDDYLNSGEISQAVHYLDSAFNNFEDAGPLDKWKRYHCLKNYYLNYVVSPSKATMYVDSMFIALSNSEDRYRSAYAKSIFARGDVLRAQYRYSEAFLEYFRGQSYARKFLDSCEHAGFTYRLGLIRYAQGDFPNAISYFKQAIKENLSCGPDRNFENRFVMPQSIYNSIAFSYEQASRPDSALYFYELGIKFIKAFSAPDLDRKLYMESALGVFYGNLGGQYAQLGRYQEAESYLKRSIEINDRKGYAVEDASTAKYKLASMFIKIGRQKEAKTYISQLDQDMTSREGNNLGKSSMQMKLVKLKALYFHSTGEDSSSLSNFIYFDQMRDSALLSERMTWKQDAEAAFREADKTFRLELAQKQAMAKSYYILALVVLSISIVVILGIVWWNLKRTRGHNIELSGLNKRITEQNEHLRQTALVLEQNQEENSKLIKLVAHDLRNPIGAVYMSASILLQQQALRPQDENLVDIIKKTATDCLAMVDELLAPKDSEKSLTKKTEDLLHILKFCIDQLKHKAKEKHQHIELKGSSIEKDVDVAKIWRVFSNLIGNAVKFSPEGAQILVVLEAVGSTARISVRDHGIGIPEELQDKIFDMPQEARRKGTAGEETHGLGLAIARQIVEQHDGKLWFESAAGTTTFYVELI